MVCATQTGRLMDNSKPSPAELAALIDRLENQLTIEGMKQLADLIDELVDATGYGAVKIILVDGRVVRLKDERSHEKL